MKNLHNIDSTIPEWVKLLSVAWNSYGTTILFYYPQQNMVARKTFPKTEADWRINLHWDEKMNRADLSKFRPHLIKIMQG